MRFLSRGNDYALFLTPDSAVFKLRAAVVRIKLAGPNSHAKIEGAEAL